jgi:hypothetical protein
MIRDVANRHPPLIGAPAMLVFLSGAFVVEMSSRHAAVAPRPVSAEPAR